MVLKFIPRIVIFRLPKSWNRDKHSQREWWFVLPQHGSSNGLVLRASDSCSYCLDSQTGESKCLRVTWQNIHRWQVTEHGSTDCVWGDVCCLSFVSAVDLFPFILSERLKSAVWEYLGYLKDPRGNINFQFVKCVRKKWQHFKHKAPCLRESPHWSCGDECQSKSCVSSAKKLKTLP